MPNRVCYVATSLFTMILTKYYHRIDKNLVLLKLAAKNPNTYSSEVGHFVSLKKFTIFNNCTKTFYKVNLYNNIK